MSSIEQRETRITVTGESLVDVVVDERGHQTRKPGGSPLNVAVGLGRLGHAVELRTSYGDDTDGALIRAHLDSSLVRVDRAHAESTSTAMARIAPDGSASYEFAVTWDLPASPLPVTSRILHAGSIAAALEPGRKAVVAAMRGGRERGVVTFDPNVRPAFMGPRDEQRAYTEQLFAFSDLVKLSDEDADWLSPSWSLDAVSERILDLGASLAVITRGAAGTHLTSRWAFVDAPTNAHPTSVVDTIGAGDSYMAGLISATSLLVDAGASLAELRAGRAFTEEVLEGFASLAGRCSALTVQRTGADLPWAEEMAGPAAEAHGSELDGGGSEPGQGPGSTRVLRSPPPEPRLRACPVGSIRLSGS